MKISKIIRLTKAEGPGTRFCIWVQGCSHHCDGCFATALWDFNSGTDISVFEIKKMISDVKNSICGITFLGGEPFEQAGELSEIAAYIHSLEKSVITFTGYTHEQLTDAGGDYISLLKETDLLIDGRFDKNLPEKSRPLVGSTNQRFVFLTDRIAEKEISEYKNRFEIRADRNGSVTVNGMGDIKQLKKYADAFSKTNKEI